jgi:hypothetical protein
MSGRRNVRPFQGINMIRNELVKGMLVGMLMAPALLSGQSQSTSKPTSFSVDAGIALPLGDFGKAVGTGFGVHGSLWYKLANPKLRVRGDVGFDRFAGENSINVGGFSASTDFTVIPVIGNLVFALGDPKSTATSKPYILGGAGLVLARGSGSVTVAGRTTSSSSTDTNLGIQLGGGIEFQLAGFSTFAEARFVNAFGDGGSARYIPLSFGIKF